jgi:hypothetical protein
MRVKLKDSDDEEEEDPIIGIIDLKWHKECVESVWKLRLVFFFGCWCQITAATFHDISKAFAGL